MTASGGFWRRTAVAAVATRALPSATCGRGSVIGLYIVVISLTGSAIVLRREMDKAFCPQIILVPPNGPRLSATQFAAAAQRAFRRMPRFDPALVQVRGPRVAGAAIEVWYPFGGGRGRLERLIDPYTGKDLGDTVACEPAPRGAHRRSAR